MTAIAPLLRAAASLLVAATSAASQTVDATAGLEPFRKPSQHTLLTDDLLRELTIMANLADSGRFPLAHDESGREVCDHPAWRAALDRLAPKLAERNTATILHLVLRDSFSEMHRKLAAYGMFHLADPADVFQIMALLPADPSRELREKSFERAVGFLRAHLRENAEPTQAERDAGAPPRSRYQLIAYPFLKLLEVGDDRDRAKALWVLREVVLVRADFAQTLLEAALPRLPELVLSADGAVREMAWDFVHACDPRHRPKPQPGTEDPIVQIWLNAVLDDAFPPIRAISQGRTDLHPGPVLERLVEVGARELRADALGEPFHGKLADGRYYRGFRVTRLPDPLDRLRIPLGAIVLNVNGSPVATAAQMIEVVEQWVSARKTLMVEYLDGRGRSRVMEYRLQEKRH
jgi:hypothetical protein